MIRVNRQIKCPKICGAGSSPSSTGSFFENYTLFTVCLGSKEGPRGGLKWLIILIFKNLLLVNQQCQKIDTWYITLINLENRNPVWPNEFDLQLGCCISNAFSIFFSYYMDGIVGFSLYIICMMLDTITQPSFRLLAKADWGLRYRI